MLHNFKEQKLRGLLALLLAFAPAVVMAQTPNCVPSCDPVDGRFLAITDGVGLDTLTDTTLELQIRSPGGGFGLGFFDGETSGFFGAWDTNPIIGSFPQLTFNLFADPTGDGTGSHLVASFDGEAMPDNAWAEFAVADVAEARSPSGEYVYLLEADLTGFILAATRTVFKVKTEADVLIEVFQQPFAFAASLTVRTLGIIYPDCLGSTLAVCLASLENTTYDGNFRFFLTVRDPQEELVIWDGDLDRGDYDGSNPDTDDFNTPSDYTGLPNWACEDPTKPCTADGGSNPRSPGVNFEGIAEGVFPSTGSPPDDFDPNLGDGLGAIFLRSGPIKYEVWGPDARLLATNDDPSGNREWEVFRIAVPGTSAYLDANGLPPDFDVAELPAGIYEVRVKNLDLENLNAFRFGVPAVTEPNCEDGRPTGLTFIYTGDSCSETAASNNSQGGLPGTSGDYRCSGSLTTGDPRSVKLVPVKKPERFEMVPATAFIGGEMTIRAMTKNDRLFPHTKLEVQDALTGEVLQEVTLHTSCSQPLIVGEQFGSLKLFTYFLKF